MRRIILLSVLLNFLCFFSNGQQVDTNMVNQFTENSDSLGNTGNYKQAILLRKKALNFQQLISPPPYADLVKSYRQIGYYLRMWGKYPECYFYQQKAVSLAENKLPRSHEELAKAYNGLGSYYCGLQQFDQAYQYFNLALEVSLAAKQVDVGNYYNNVGIAQQALGNPMAAMESYKYALDFNLAQSGFYHKKTADNYDNLGTLYYNLNDFEKAIDYLDSAEIILDSLYDQESIHIAGVYNNKGAVYNRMGDHRNAIRYLEKSLSLYEKFNSGQHPETSNIYSNIGLLLQQKGDYEKALSYFKKALAIRKYNYGENNPRVARTHLYLGNCYLAKLDFEKALDEMNKSLYIFKKLPKIYEGEIADVYNSLGNYFEKLGILNEALSQYNKGFEINKSSIGQNNPDLAKSYALIGKIYLAQKKHAKAKEYFLNALTIKLNIFGENHAEAAEIYSLLALACNNDEKCINDYLKKAYRSINYDISRNTAYEKTNSPIALLKVMQANGNLLIKLFEKNNLTAYLIEADQIYSKAISLVNFIKTSLEQPSSRLALQDNFYLIYEKAILVKHLLKQRSGEIKYWEEAFKIAEQSNAILLMEAINSVEAERFAGIPDSLLLLERSYKLELAFLEKRRYEEEEKNNGINDKALQEVDDRIFDIHQKQHDLISYFRKHHEEYFKLQYEPEIISIKKLQSKLLREDQTMVAYFVGEEKIFTFIIAKNNFNVVEINKNIPLENWVEEFRNSIYKFNPADNESAYLNQKLANIGYELFQLIFDPIQKHINTNSLIIVPGGVLGYLPFDALLSSPAEDYSDFDNFDFLIRNFNISYSYSATLLAEMVSGKHKKKPFVAFAPSYFGDTLNVTRSNDPWRAVLGRLHFNTREASMIHEMMGGKLFLDSLATEEQFVKVASDAGILHLATHGKSNDRHGEYSYLAFYQSNDNVENELLFVKNLYDMEIPASLVVLSACETGIGELQRGEGIVSLARGFSYAGAASIVTTLWSIDDNASANIMVDFYKNLKAGEPKDIALRNAKLNYMEKNIGNNRTHPLFWAAFVPVGNMTPISNTLPWWIWALIASCLMFIGFAYIRRK